jgi:hypothetical protein
MGLDSANESVDEFEHDDAAEDKADAAHDSCFPELARSQALACAQGGEPDELGREEQEPECSPEEPEQGDDTEKAFRGHAWTRHSLPIFSGWSSDYEFHFQVGPMVS